MKAWVRCLGYSHHLSSSDCFPTSVKRTEIQATAIWSNLSWLFPNSNLHSVGNKAKGRISKRSSKKTKHAKFSKKQTFLTPWYAQVPVFQKIWRALFSWNTRFEIRPFALLPKTQRSQDVYLFIYLFYFI